MRVGIRFVLAIAALCTFVSQVNAGSFTVYVGYADSLRPSPFFPNPYDTADIFQGNVGALDSGAVRIQNTGATNLTLDGLTVTLNPAGGGPGTQTFSLWSFGAGLTLLPGQNAVFGSTANYNFDTSDFGVLGTFAPNNDNCSVGPTAATALCINNAPIVAFTVDGILTPLSDTGHVLDTGGFDLVNANPCPGGNNANNQPGNCNESLQWREIGTTGIENPGGSVPEPGTLALVAISVLGLATARRRKTL
jgi:hypothetical protein